MASALLFFQIMIRPVAAITIAVSFSIIDFRLRKQTALTISMKNAMRAERKGLTLIHQALLESYSFCSANLYLSLNESF